MQCWPHTVLIHSRVALVALQCASLQHVGMSDLESKLTEVEEEYRAGKMVLIRTKVSEILFYIAFLLLGELTESGYRKRKLRLEKEILKRDYEEGMYSMLTWAVYQNQRQLFDPHAAQSFQCTRGRRVWDHDVSPYLKDTC